LTGPIQMPTMKLRTNDFTVWWIQGYHFFWKKLLFVMSDLSWCEQVNYVLKSKCYLGTGKPRLLTTFQIHTNYRFFWRTLIASNYDNNCIIYTTLQASQITMLKNPTVWLQKMTLRRFNYIFSHRNIFNFIFTF
jgi:hypothetical protein